MGTKDCTDKALIEALSENRPLTDEQRSVLVSVVMQQAQRDLNADRYLWLRPRLQVCNSKPLSGGGPRPSLEVRIGQAFLTPQRAGRKAM